MPPPRELRVYLTAAVSLPILLTVVNHTVVTSLLQTVRTVSFAIWYASIALYLLIRMKGYTSKIRRPSAQIAIEASILSAPLIYPAYSILALGNLQEYEGVFMAYLLAGIIILFYQISRADEVGSIEKIGYFLLAYLFALMVYAGAQAGQQTGSSFLQIAALEQLLRAGALIGYPVYLTSTPSADYMRIALAVAIPAIIYLTLSAEVERVEAEGELKAAGVKISSSLRPAIILLTFAASSTLSLTLPLSLWLGGQNLGFAAILPPLSLAGPLILILLISERYAYAPTQ